MKNLSFKIDAECDKSKARACTFQTLHGEVKTPIFMPVGTRATIRAQTADSIARANPDIILANTYHLMISPGIDVFKKFHGIHGFMKWDKPVLTDSGGFQIFSLPNNRQITEEGARFRNYLNGDEIFLSPEQSIEMQRAIGSDIMMVLDQCIPSTATVSEATEAMHLTHRWAERSLRARQSSKQALFGIIQGACHKDLRKISAEVIQSIHTENDEFDGYAIGGLAVGESKQEREDMTEWTTTFMRKDRPRYLMGVGTPADILEAVYRGVDMFDCVIPTMLGQQGVAYTYQGRMNLKKSIYKFSQDPIDSSCTCYTCKNYSLAYLHHLVKQKEIYGWHLVGAHNIHFMLTLTRDMRKAILEQRFQEFYTTHRQNLMFSDGEQPISRTKENIEYSLGNFEIDFSSEGYARIRQRSSGEIMHPIQDPNEEVRRIYISQSNITERMKNNQKLVLWDVGLGAAHNAMAAIYACEAEQAGSLQIESFENDIDALRLALKYGNYFKHLDHEAPRAIAQNKKYISEKINWRLIEGDFLSTMAFAKKPDVIFFDPFSFKTDTELWTLECFEKMVSFIQDQEKWVELYTYSNSTGVRAALLGAGFFVAPGISTGVKTATTVAFLPPKQLTITSISELPERFKNRFQFYGEEWIRKWQISSSKFPYNLSDGRQQAFEASIIKHAQFR